MNDAKDVADLTNTPIEVETDPDVLGDAPVIGAIDLFADDEAVTVTAETRNADASSVKVTLADDKLWIGLGEGPLAIRRDVKLPKAVDEESAVATFRNGVLDVVLPVKKPKRGA